MTSVSIHNHITQHSSVLAPAKEEQQAANSLPLSQSTRNLFYQLQENTITTRQFLTPDHYRRGLCSPLCPMPKKKAAHPALISNQAIFFLSHPSRDAPCGERETKEGR